MRKKAPPSLRDLVMVVPRPVRRYIRYRLLAGALGNTLGKIIDDSRSELHVSRGKRLVRGNHLDGLARQLHSRLLGGFSERALAELEALKRDPFAPPGQVSHAARILGAWQLDLGEVERAHENALLARHADPRAMHSAAQLNLEVDCLTALGKREEARLLLQGGLSLDPTNVSLRLALANTFTSPGGATDTDDDEKRLEEMRRVFLDHDLLPVEIKDASRPLRLDNLAVPRAEHHPADTAHPKVSVFVCAYRASQTLHIALDSLLAQTWSNLEVIIVDDQSPDDTLAVAKVYEAQDARVRAIQQATNSGPYAGRNLALTLATGELITVHDADDWSHPQKLEVQVRDLIQNPEAPGNITDWVRCSRHLYFCGTDGSSTRVGLNHSSLLLRAQLLRALGGWDPVRFGADTELIRRVESVYGALSRPYQGVPLSFALDQTDSLTRQNATHTLTRFHGVRRVYHDAGAHWRRIHQAPADWKVINPDGSRVFPAPRPMFARDPAPFECDLLYVMDWVTNDSALRSVLSHLRGAIDCGLRLGVFHYGRFQSEPSEPPCAELLQLAHEGKVYRVSPGEELTTDTVLVGCPALLVDKLDRPPVVQCRRVAILADTFSAGRDASDPLCYDPAIVNEAVRTFFGHFPKRVPTSLDARELLSK